ncbi:ArsR/SmtB family transcription factor [Fundicoccus sp. Sow4_H7]|uniref:ArsR/SmtB family transcription factor n=1 Tax=Fundicoccus sp. Sow4_H7 TaxID=3438784 RepID=UPI003F8FEA49
MNEYECLNDEQIEEQRDEVDLMLDNSLIEEKANIFKVLGDLNRVKIVELLMNYDRLCVYEISQFIGASVATTSHHLITLRKNDIITSEKIGKHVIYSLQNEKISILFETANGLKLKCDKSNQLANA